MWCYVVTRLAFMRPKKTYIQTQRDQHQRSRESYIQMWCRMVTRLAPHTVYVTQCTCHIVIQTHLYKNKRDLYPQIKRPWPYMCVLQCVAVCCSVLQCVAVCCRHIYVHIWMYTYIRTHIHVHIYMYMSHCICHIVYVTLYMWHIQCDISMAHYHSDIVQTQCTCTMWHIHITLSCRCETRPRSHVCHNSCPKCE